MNGSFYFEQHMRHYQEEQSRNERRAQHLAELRLVERNPAGRFEARSGLIARIPHLRRARSPREAYS